MTFKDEFSKYLFPHNIGGALRFWTFVEISTHKGPSVQALRQIIRDWWNSLSEHEKLGITDIPLPLLNDTVSDWTQTTNRYEP